ncbi:translation initiation factor IF-2, partial [Candidatus Omnitrophota bacterium]
VERGARPKPFGRRTRKRPQVEIIDKGAGRGRGRRPVKAAPAKPAERKTSVKLEVMLPISIRDLAQKMSIKPNAIIQQLMAKGAMVNINQELDDEEMVREIMSNLGHILEIPESIASIEKELVKDHHEGSKTAGESRAPVVTFMGHVDHGKTSLLDYIRKTMVTKGEKGGITQHIGAYKVETSNGAVTFLDTPGHAAFTAMRARGANATDVVVLVVAADDGVMPQTKEAIDHARAAKVPIVVAINKCDLPGADPERVKQGLQVEGLADEKWGGTTAMVEVSAHTGDGVDDLVEVLMLESEMLELKANPNIKARGVVIEGKKTPGQGVVATLLVQNGTLRPNDIVLCGSFYGKVKAMMSDVGDRVEAALPATPVEVLGLQGVPEAGDEFFVVKDEKKAKTLSLLKQSEGRMKKMGPSQRITLEDFHSLVAQGEVKELKIVLKADVQGSEEALKHSLEELSTEEVKLDVIHSATGNINESDVMLAMVSNAVIIGFHVKTDTKAEELSKEENVDLRVYDIIYEAIADIKAAMEGLLEPEEKEVFQGRAQVREIFSASKIGKVAGCAIIKGTIHNKDKVRVKRGDETVYDGNIDALKRFKDDVKEVKEGFECGISVRGFTDIRVNDVIESYIIEKIARRLEK